MNLLALTDSTLAALNRQTNNEIARRAKAATNGYDAASIIHGNEMAKRALLVATAGNHSILFIGPPNCGKTMLRAVALELGLGNTFEARPCPCGYARNAGVDWQQLVASQLHEIGRTAVPKVSAARDYDLECLRQVVEDYGNVADQEAAFRTLTRRSRATFFRLKKMLGDGKATDTAEAAMGVASSGQAVLQPT